MSGRQSTLQQVKSLGEKLFVIVVCLVALSHYHHQLKSILKTELKAAVGELKHEVRELASAQPPARSDHGGLTTAVTTASSPPFSQNGYNTLQNLEYRYCADEGQLCKCAGLIRFGATDQWSPTVQKGPNGAIMCTNEAFSDPAPGMAKHCECGETGVASSSIDEAIAAENQEQHERTTRTAISKMQAQVGRAAPGATVIPEYTMDGAKLVGNSRVLYGIATCALPMYNEIMDAVISTWAAHLPREQLVVAGGKYDDFAHGLEDHPTPCGDHSQWFWCKEATVLYRAALRAERLGAHWLQVIQEDKFVWTSHADAQLQRFDHQKPIVLAPYGCAQHWKFHESSKGGTLPRPSTWPVDENCPPVDKFGAICGGPGYYVSAGMLRELLKGSSNLMDFLVRYRTASGVKAGVASSDIMSTCFFYRQAPAGDWRVRGTSKLISTLTGGQSMLHTADGKVDGQQADAAKFHKDWLVGELPGELPLIVHVNHKVNVAGYIRDMHKIKFELSTSQQPVQLSQSPQMKGSPKSPKSPQVVSLERPQPTDSISRSLSAHIMHI